YARAKLALRYKEKLAKENDRRMKAGQKPITDVVVVTETTSAISSRETDPRLIPDEGSQRDYGSENKRRTDSQVAAMAEVSRDKINKVEAIEQSAPEEIRDAAERGEVSINAAAEFLKYHVGPEIKKAVRTKKVTPKEAIELVKADNQAKALKEFLKQKGKDSKAVPRVKATNPIGGVADQARRVISIIKRAHICTESVRKSAGDLFAEGGIGPIVLHMRADILGKKQDEKKLRKFLEKTRESCDGLDAFYRLMKREWK